MSGMLYIVPTPIGNLADMTYRGVEVLKSVDAIACEDTRHSLVLLNHYGIKKPLISFHKFNTQKAMPALLRRLEEGRSLAVISDAGMPCVSDPGTELVAAAIERGIPYTVLPGPCAAVNAVVLSGWGGGGFAFAGFLPERTRDRKEIAQRFKDVGCPVAFYCSPHAIEEDIRFLYGEWGDRRAAACKELTKLNERAEFFTLGQGLPTPPRGEYVLVVEAGERTNELLALTPEQHLQYYIEAGMDKREAVKRVAAERKVPKNEIYKLANPPGRDESGT